MATKRASVNGIEIAWDEVGSGEPPFVLVHGYTGWRQDFAPRLPELAAHGRTLVYDQRGHGDSSHADAAGYSLEQLADDLLALLEALGVARCDLLGHSMGGMVTLRAVLRQPERFRSLVLMNTAARVPDDLPRELFERAWQVARTAGMATLQTLARARVEQDPTRTAADRALERAGGEAYWERHRRRFLAMDPQAYAALGRAILEQESLVPRLEAVRCPTLVMVGEQDRSFLAPADELERGIPGAVRVTVPGAGHSPQLENPTAWSRAVQQHLRRVRALEGRAHEEGSPCPSSN